MNAQYNLSNLEADFKQYLLAVNTKPLNSITIKNYLSDLRHFMGWINSDFRGLKADSHGLNQRKSAQRESVSVSAQILPLLQAVTSTVVSDYKNYLTSNNIPPKTINRRLSTLRKFGSFCISQGWMKENAFKRISNVIPNAVRDLTLADDRSLVSLGMTKRDVSNSASRNDILDQYQQYLVKQNLDRKNINNLIADVEEFYQLTQPNL